MRRITILEKTREDNDNRYFNVVFWLPVPAGRESYYRDTSLDWVPGEGQTEDDRPARTFFSNTEGTGADPTAAELLSLREGKTTERVEEVAAPKRDGNGVLYTNAMFRTQTANRITSRYQQLMSDVEAYNPRQLWGTTYSDESGWTVRFTS